MSTPATLKQMEIAREKAARRNRQSEYGLAPLSAWSPRYNTDYRPRKNIDFTVDRAGGRQYTSFEGNRKDGEPRAPPKPLTPPPVEDVPIDIDTDDYKVDAEKVICFNGRQNFLSNLYPVTLTVEGHEYPSVEHYYQACKLYTLGGAQLAAQIRRIPDAGQVKVFAKRLLRKAGVSLEKIEEWKHTQGPVLLHHAIVHKFVQNADLREKLLETGDAILAHTYDRDNIFATGCDREKMLEWAKNNNGQIIKIPTKIDNDTIVYIPLVGEGKNVLGFINMKVRGQVRHFQATKPNITDPIMLVAMQTLQLNGPSKGEGDK
ncbi:Uncharacterized protein F44E2.8 [Toxocara canis]|uniref:Uncharacterized protein F44E2.8 n=2 Tax=Toxocara canis TaxID=6265 RepID=A0A0B2V8F5_TOXCA|nr:Uncharacterized protein F44E2.8 [Toxocara canis]VDM38682.1 unnamed protein product [Toxocara canis]